MQIKEVYIGRNSVEGIRQFRVGFIPNSFAGGSS